MLHYSGYGEQVTRFESYSEWNPFVLEAHTEFNVGANIHFLEDLKKFGQHWIDAKFMTIEPPNFFVWHGYFGALFLFAVRHSSFIFEGD